MQARNIYNDPKTLFQFYLKTGPHADTHINENKPRVLYWILAAEERDDSWGSESSWVPDRRSKGVLRDAAPGKGRWFGPQSHVWDSWFVTELRW